MVFPENIEVEANLKFGKLLLSNNLSLKSYFCAKDEKNTIKISNWKRCHEYRFRKEDILEIYSLFNYVIRYEKIKPKERHTKFSLQCRFKVTEQPPN